MSAPTVAFRIRFSNPFSPFTLTEMLSETLFLLKKSHISEVRREALVCMRMEVLFPLFLSSSLICFTISVIRGYSNNGSPPVMDMKVILSFSLS